jgi:DNA-binding PadR family transcriptional regulator
MAINDTNPLSPATFHVLLSLASQDMHGYGIILEVGRLSDGQYRLGPGTLYDNLKKLLNLGWVEDYESEGDTSEEKRRLYHLTDEGRNVLAADVRRMKRVVRIANRRLGEEGSKA